MREFSFRHTCFIVRRKGMIKPPVQLVVGKKSYRKVKEEPPML